MCCHTHSLLTWIVALVILPAMNHFSNKELLVAHSLHIGLLSKIFLVMEIVLIRRK